MYGLYGWLRLLKVDPRNFVLYVFDSAICGLRTFRIESLMAMFNQYSHLHRDQRH